MSFGTSQRMDQVEERERSKPEGVRKERCQCRTRTEEVGRRDRDTDGYRHLLH